MSTRDTSFGEAATLSRVDKLGIAMSARRLKAEAGSLNGKRFGDFGSGFNALLVRDLLPQLAHAVVIDLSLADDLKSNPKITAIEFGLPDALKEIPDGSLDVVVCNSVLEHLWEPEATAREMYRVLADGGLCFVNVPSWRGKKFLEFSAFRLGKSPAEEMNDHKMYYDPRDLWPMFVAAGFRPQDIKCRKHKFGLNTYASCKK